MATTLTSTGITFPDATTQTTAAASAFPSGTLMLFQQTTAPTGWTKQTTHDNKALRVVTGTAGSGGTTAFTSVFTNQTPTITLSGLIAGATTLAISQMPSHRHPTYAQAPTGQYGWGKTNIADDAYNSNYISNASTTISGQVAPDGGGGSHTHSMSGSATSSAITLNVAYVDLIIASKN